MRSPFETRPDIFGPRPDVGSEDDWEALMEVGGRPPPRTTVLELS